MNAMLRITLACLFWMGLAVTGASASALDPEVERRLDRYIETSAAAWQVPAVAVGIVSGDELVYTRGVGTTHSGSPVDEHTLFEIGSATKAFLGATQAIMVDRGAFAWDDRVVDRYPRFAMRDRWVTRNATIADLLAQRSGLPQDSGSELFLLGYGKRRAIQALSRIPAASSFRSEFAYQNLPHLVAGDIVARAAGTASWPEALDRLLLGPLGMTETAATRDALERSPNTTRGHQRVGGATRELALGAFPANAEGSGAIVSSVADLSRWLRLQIGNGAIDGTRLISEQQIAVTRRPRIVVDERFAAPARVGHDRTYPVTYATGWFVHSLAEGRIIEHGGNTVGYASAVAFDPDRRVGIVVLTNLAFGEGLARPLAMYALDLLQGREPRDYAQESLEVAQAGDAEVATPSRPVAPARLRRLAGRYRSAVYGALRLAPRGRDRLAVTLGPARARGELVALGGDDFRLEMRTVPQSEGSALLVAAARVLRGRDGRVTGMNLGLNPTNVPFVRVDRAARRGR